MTRCSWLVVVVAVTMPTQSAASVPMRPRRDVARLRYRAKLCTSLVVDEVMRAFDKN
jgi:hypothetical protein